MIVSSFGDIVAVVQPAIEIAELLWSIRSASSQFQELLLEVDALGAALASLHIILAARSPDRQFPPTRAAAVAGAVSRCRSIMESFTLRNAGYRANLQVGGSGGALRDAARKGCWGLFKRKEVVNFKREIVGQKTTIIMVVMFAQW